VLKYRRAVRAVASKIDEAIDISVDALRQGRVEHEPAMTDRMLGGIEQGIHGNIGGIKWSAKTLTDRGPGSQESEFGADFMGVLDVDLPDFTVSKGFLAQAKMGKRISSKEKKRLLVQCENMLDHSPASFVFIYSNHGVRVVPAVSVVAAQGNLGKLYDRSAKRFFEEHLECFIGDPRIACPSPKTLENLRLDFQARSAIFISGGRIDDENFSKSQGAS